MKRCLKCGETKPLEAFHRDRSKRDGHHTTCKECAVARVKARHESLTAEQRLELRQYHREYARSTAHRRKAKYRAARLEGIRRYGGCCACCGEDREPFLTFDHVGEWGSEHRSTDSTATSLVLWLARRDYPQDGTIRLLCWNCNCARGTYGYCPHEVEAREADGA